VNVAGGNNVTLSDASGGLNLGNVSTTGGLNVSSNGGDITDSGNVVVGGTTTLNAGGGNVALDNAGTDFSGQVSVAGGNNVTLSDASGGLNLGNVSTTSGLNVSSNGGDITDSGNVVVAGTTTLNAAGGNVVLDNAGGAFGGQVNVSDVVNVSFSASGTLNILVVADGNGSVTARGDLNAQLDLGGNGSVTSTGGKVNLDVTGIGGDLTVLARGDITQTGALTVAGATSMVTIAGNVVLDLANNFGGALTVVKPSPVDDASVRNYQPQLPNPVVEQSLFNNLLSLPISTTEPSGTLQTTPSASTGQGAGIGSTQVGLEIVSVNSSVATASSGESETSEDPLTVALNNALASAGGAVQAISVDGGIRAPEDAYVSE
jgi:hypothetical protein